MTTSSKQISFLSPGNSGPIVDYSSLRNFLEYLLEFLRSQATNLFSEEQISSFTSETQELLARAKVSGDTILIGIAGGTGVGKSTLINALAKANISSPSDRRPYTDRAIIYRHEEVETLLDTDPGLFRKPDATHRIDSIRDTVVLDMPDFDSHEQGNALTVSKLAPHMDMMVWVVSPEKYADASFFAFIKNCQTHKDNFCFVFNKSDQLLDQNSSDRYTRLKEALGDFIFHLKRTTGIDNPRVFALSGFLESSHSASDQFLNDEFSRFRAFILAKRKAKEIQSIKFLNLLNNSKALFARVFADAKPEARRRALRSVLENEDEGVGLAPLPGNTIVSEIIASAVFGRLIESDTSLKTIKMIMKLLSRRKIHGADNFSSLTASMNEAMTEFSQPWLNRLSRIQGKIKSESILGDLGKAESRSSAINSSDLRNHAIENMFKSSDLTKQRLRSFLNRLFQSFWLTIPVGLFLFRFHNQVVIGHGADFNIWSIFWMVISIGSNLFSPEGLSSLLSLVILEAILVFWLANRRLKKLSRISQGVASGILSNFEKQLDRRVDEVTEALRESLKSVGESLDQLERLSKMFDAGNRT